MNLQLRILCNVLIISTVTLGVKTLPETCLLPKASGETGQYCNSDTTMYYFNQKTYKCHKFHYSGCGGNANRYFTRQECESACPLTEEEKAKQDNINKIQKVSYPDNPLLQTSAALRIDSGQVKAAEGKDAVTTTLPTLTTTGKTEEAAKKSKRRTRKLKGKNASKKRPKGKSARRRSRKRNRGKSHNGRARGKSGRYGRGRRGKSRGRRGRRGKSAKRTNSARPSNRGSRKRSKAVTTKEDTTKKNEANKAGKSGAETTTLGGETGSPSLGKADDVVATTQKS